MAPTKKATSKSTASEEKAPAKRGRPRKVIVDDGPDIGDPEEITSFKRKPVAKKEDEPKKVPARRKPLVDEEDEEPKAPSTRRRRAPIQDDEPAEEEDEDFDVDVETGNDQEDDDPTPERPSQKRHGRPKKESVIETSEEAPEIPEISLISEKIEMPDFRNEVRIDRFRLEVAAEKLPDLHGKYAMDLADKKSVVDRLEAHLKYLKAERFLHYQQNPPKDMKTTDSTIKNLVEADPSVTEVQDKILDAQDALNILQAAIDTISHARSQLKNLTMLWIAGYYSESSEGPAEDRNYDEKTADNVRSGLKSFVKDNKSSSEEEDDESFDEEEEE